MRVSLINKNRSSTKVGNTAIGINLDDMIIIEETEYKKYKIYSPNFRLYFNKSGKGFEISFIKDREDFVIKKKIMGVLYGKADNGEVPELTFLLQHSSRYQSLSLAGHPYIILC